MQKMRTEETQYYTSERIRPQGFGMRTKQEKEVDTFRMNGKVRGEFKSKKFL